MLLSSMSIILISVVIVIRMAKKENYGFFALTFFLLAFVISLLDMILINTHYLFILMLVASILGFLFTLFAVIPLEKLGDTESFNAILAEAKPVDFVLLGIYIAFSAAFLIYVAIAGNNHFRF